MATRKYSKFTRKSAVPVIDRIKAELAVEGLTKKKMKARQWLDSKLSHLWMKPSLVMSDEIRDKVARPQIGKMYFYYYDAKWKMKLPFWDAFPLTIPMEFYDDGFLGLNFHYLTPQQRTYLISRLMTFVENRNLTEETRLRWSYGLLKSMRNFRMAKPAIKRYLYSHVRSPFMEIPAPEWDIALFLPVENFNINKKRVWRLSRNG